MKKRVTASGLNIRSGPGTEFPIWDSMRRGETFTPPDLTGWVPVLMQDNTIGFVSAEYLEDVTEAEPEPVQVQEGAYDFSSREGTIEAIKAECLKQGLGMPEQIAYVLATTEWETARTFEPVREAYWKDEGWRRRNLSRYYPYYGRGHVQLTWLDNYRKATIALRARFPAEADQIDLVENPDQALNPKYSVFLMVNGFKTGAFTGKKLTDYVNASDIDFYNARRCINALDRAKEIANLALKYLEDL